jgi:hypothetical protein
MDLQNIVKPLITTGKLVKVQNEAGASLECIPGTSTWINNIGDWSNTEGYKIRVNSPGTLSVTGKPITDPVAISLRSGWNIIGYPSFASYDAAEILSPLINSGSLVKAQDQAGASIERIPGTQTWINNIGDFDPDEGYKVRVSANDVLTITPSPIATGTSLKMSQTSELKSAGANHFKPVWSGNGLDQMNIYIQETNDKISGIQPGDEIGFFDGTNCVGAGKITNINEPFHSFIASADDPTTEEADGFIEGHKLSFRIWTAGNEKEIQAGDIQYASGCIGIFEAMGTTVASLGTTVSIDPNSIDMAISAMMYPNPFNEDIFTALDVNKATDLKVSFYNVLGAEIYSKVVNTIPGTNTLHWNGTDYNGELVKQGVYFIKITSPDLTYNQTFEIIKY